MDQKRGAVEAKSAASAKRLRQEQQQESSSSVTTTTHHNAAAVARNRRHPTPLRLFKTINQDSSMSGDDSDLCMTLRQVLGFDGNLPDVSIEWLVIGNYLIDPDFLLNEVPELLSVKCTVVFYGHEDAPFTAWRQAVGRDAIDFRCLQPSEPPGPLNPTTTKIPYGVHHTKMFLIGFSNQTIRVVVHTANLRYSDIHMKAQGLYLQDFPLKKTTQTATTSSPFETTLLDYLDTYRYTEPRTWIGGEEPGFLRSVIRRYDYSAASAVLIPSTPGYHRLDTSELRGHLKVRQVITQFTSVPDNSKVNAKSQQPIICQFSSIGSLSEKYLREVQSSFDTRLARRPLSTSTTTKDASPIRIQMVYPTVQEIRESIEGYVGGGSVPGSLRNVSKPFLRPLFCRWKPKQQVSTATAGQEPAKKEKNPLWKPNNVPHIKSYFQHSPDRESLEYFVLGSQNLSMAAWGTVQNDFRSGGRKLFIRHWELGVFVSPQLCGGKPLVPWRPELAHKDGLVPIPLPFSHIPESYDASDEPWAVDVRYEQPDMFGRTSVQG